MRCTWAWPASRWSPSPPDPPPLRTSVCSVSVVDAPESIPNFSSSERELLGLCRTVANFASTSARSRGWREGTSPFGGTARVGLARRRMRRTPAPAPRRVRASCNTVRSRNHQHRRARTARFGGGAAIPLGAESFAVLFALRAFATGKLNRSCPSSAELGGDIAQFSSTPLYLSSHAPVRTNDEL